ncbi:hypothetical protein GWI33_009868 [Rhynchophorus ferrugineus]|uniref:Uncharacterized protein n=1 Tax=Rhynchophorus ferrugineus TaxID=354439 RepID=A0A834ICU2_RHYFE|nr:hypothetical protein GWI33_009868 [Rhynchophorus ferrugineus]
MENKSIGYKFQLPVQIENTDYSNRDRGKQCRVRINHIDNLSTASTVMYDGQGGEKGRRERGKKTENRKKLKAKSAKRVAHPKHPTENLDGTDGPAQLPSSPAALDRRKRTSCRSGSSPGTRKRVRSPYIIHWLSGL